MSELHLNQPGFSPCGPFTKHRERIQKFRETGNLKHFCKNKLDKACFAHDAEYSDSKDLAKRTISDKILKDRSHETARNRNYDGYQKALESIVYKFFNKKTGSEVSLNEQLAEELHKPVIKKIKRTKVYTNTWAADVAEMGSLSSKNKIIYYVSQIFSLNMHGLNL